MVRLLVLVLACLLPSLPADAATVLPAVAGPRAPAPDDREPEGVWPLAPEPDVVRPFDPPADPWGAGHRGVDLAGRPGQVVRSALPGTVAFAGSVAGKPVVAVDHGGRRTTYEPVVATVAVGDEVAAGDPIGRLVVLHSHCFPAACLHWGLRRGETYLDPLSLVGGGPVRLLPLWRDQPVAAPSVGAAAPPWRPVLAAWQPPLAGWRPPLDVLA
jgi:murein DD-endopeptidase MepM/ murein hydrolase activator NlpD